jgi:hypothetical protein
MTSIALHELNIAPKDWKKLLEIPAADLLVIQLKMSSLMAQSEYVKKNGCGFVPNSFNLLLMDLASASSLTHSPEYPKINHYDRLE